MSGDIVDRLRLLWTEPIDAVALYETINATTVEIVRLRAEIVRLTAERDASRRIVNDLTAEVERLRTAGDRLAAAVNAVACSGPQDEMAELTDAFLDWEGWRG